MAHPRPSRNSDLGVEERRERSRSSISLPSGWDARRGTSPVSAMFPHTMQYALAWDVARLLVGICAAAAIFIAELVPALLFVATR